MVKRPIIMICFLGFVVYKSESTKDLKFLSTTPTTNGNSKTSMSTYWGRWWTNGRDSSIRLMVKKWTWWNTLRIASCLQDYICWRRCQTLYQRHEGICACKLLKLYNYLSLVFTRTYFSERWGRKVFICLSFGLFWPYK